MSNTAEMRALDAVPPDAGAPAPLERHYSVKSASVLLDQKAPWFWREIRDGRIRAVRIRSIGDPRRWSVRIPESELRKLLREETR